MALLETSSDRNTLTIRFVEGKILDTAVVQGVQDELFALLGKTVKPDVVLDFQLVKLLSSGALGMLTRVHKRCLDLKLNLRLCNLAPGVREVFEFTRLDKVLSIQDS